MDVRDLFKNGHTAKFPCICILQLLDSLLVEVPALCNRLLGLIWNCCAWVITTKWSSLRDDRKRRAFIDAKRRATRSLVNLRWTGCWQRRTIRIPHYSYRPCLSRAYTLLRKGRESPFPSRDQIYFLHKWEVSRGWASNGFLGMLLGLAVAYDTSTKGRQVTLDTRIMSIYDDRRDFRAIEDAFRVGVPLCIRRHIPASRGLFRERRIETV